MLTGMFSLGFIRTSVGIRQGLMLGRIGSASGRSGKATAQQFLKKFA
jgi:hypothetical protein